MSAERSWARTTTNHHGSSKNALVFLRGFRVTLSGSLETRCSKAFVANCGNVHAELSVNQARGTTSSGGVILSPLRIEKHVCITMRFQSIGKAKIDPPRHGRRTHPSRLSIPYTNRATTTSRSEYSRPAALVRPQARLRPQSSLAGRRCSTSSLARHHPQRHSVL